MVSLLDDVIEFVLSFSSSCAVNVLWSITVTSDLRSFRLFKPFKLFRCSSCHPIISCSSKIQNGSFLVPAYPGCPGKRPLNGCSSSSNLDAVARKHRNISLDVVKQAPVLYSSKQRYCVTQTSNDIHPKCCHVSLMKLVVCSHWYHTASPQLECNIRLQAVRMW